MTPVGLVWCSLCTRPRRSWKKSIAPNSCNATNTTAEAGAASSNRGSIVERISGSLSALYGAPARTRSLLSRLQLLATSELQADAPVAIQSVHPSAEVCPGAHISQYTRHNAHCAYSIPPRQVLDALDESGGRATVGDVATRTGCLNTRTAPAYCSSRHWFSQTLGTSQRCS